MMLPGTLQHELVAAQLQCSFPLGPSSSPSISILSPTDHGGLCGGEVPLSPFLPPSLASTGIKSKVYEKMEGPGEILIWSQAD